VAQRLRERKAFVIVAITVVALDQATKLAIVHALRLNESRTVVSGFFDLSHSLNPGGVWGVGRDVAPALRFAVFLALPAVITLLAAWYSFRLDAGDWLRQGSIALVVGGAVGNLIDRLRLAHVIDFLRFHVGRFAWPDFNVADSAICVGVAVLLLAAFFEGEERTEPQRRAAADR
jgi:signal peptidase II